MSNRLIDNYIFEATDTTLSPCDCVRIGNRDLLVPSEDLVVTPYLKRNRNWDPNLSRWLIKIARTSSVFLDVGTMIGYFGVISFEANSDLEIHLIDPDEKNLRIAYENVKQQSNTKLYNCAVSPQNTFGWGLSRDVHNHGNTRITNFLESESDSKIATIDLGTAINELNPDLIKVDIQGLEEIILRELNFQYFSETVTFICEISLAEWKEPGSFKEILMRFMGANFRTFYILSSETLVEILEGNIDALGILLTGDHFDVIFDRGGRVLQ